MAEEKKQWIGKGVFNWKGKDYGYGEELPDDIDSKVIARYRKEGCIGEVHSPLVLNPEIQVLTTKVEALIAEIEEQEDQIATLEKNNTLLESQNLNLQAELEKLRTKGKKKTSKKSEKKTTAGKDK